MISSIAFIFMILSILLQIIFLFRKFYKSGLVSSIPLIFSSLLLFFIIIQRSFTIRFIAMTNMFESMVFFSASISLIVSIILIKSNKKIINLIAFGGTVISIAMLSIASSPLMPQSVVPPVPALRSYWLVLHVSFAFIGEAFFAVSFIASIVYFASKTDAKDDIDRIIYTSIGIGYPVYTAGALVFGSIWAEVAWGTWWSWDPKETWALITWLTYTAYLHMRGTKSLNKNITVLISMLGFLFTVFTYFGVNYLLSGMHSYR